MLMQKNKNHSCCYISRQPDCSGLGFQCGQNMAAIFLALLCMFIVYFEFSLLYTIHFCRLLLNFNLYFILAFFWFKRTCSTFIWSGYVTNTLHKRYVRNVTTKTLIKRLTLDTLCNVAIVTFKTRQEKHVQAQATYIHDKNTYPERLHFVAIVLNENIRLGYEKNTLHKRFVRNVSVTLPQTR